MSLYILPAQYKSWIEQLDLSQEFIALIHNASVVVITILLAYCSFKATKWFVRKLTHIINKRKKLGIIEEALDMHGFFSYISYHIPFVIIKMGLANILSNQKALKSILEKGYDLAVVILFVLLINSILSAFIELRQKKKDRTKPVKGLVQFLQIVTWCIGFIICLSILFSKEPTAIIGGLGAASAILMLIFKDTITGLVAGVQLSFNKMIEIGDWISLSKYGIDGEVVDITITTVKVKNWDKSVSSVPSYSLVVSDSVKNWKPMTYSGRRNISRSIVLDMITIKACTPEMLERFNKIAGVSEAMQSLEMKDDGTVTNLSVFRAYIYHYLRNNKKVDTTQDLIVRQLQSNQYGLPLEIYCFANTSSWQPFEDTLSEIFEHIFSVVALFDLNVFQSNGNGKMIGS